MAAGISLWTTFLALVLFIVMHYESQATLTHTLLDGDCPGPAFLYVGASVQVALRSNPYQYPKSDVVECELNFRAQHSGFRLLLAWEHLILSPDKNNYVLSLYDKFKVSGPLMSMNSSMARLPHYITHGNVLNLYYRGKPYSDSFLITVTEIIVSASGECQGRLFTCVGTYLPIHFCIDDSLLCNGENNCGDRSDENNPSCTGDGKNSLVSTDSTPGQGSMLPLGLLGGLGGVAVTIIIVLIVCLIVNFRRRRLRYQAGLPHSSSQLCNRTPAVPALERQLNTPTIRECNQYVPLPTLGPVSNGHTSAKTLPPCPPPARTPAPPAPPPPEYMNTREERELPDLFQLADMTDMLLLHTAGYPRGVGDPAGDQLEAAPQPDVSISEPGYIDIATLNSGRPPWHPAPSAPLSRPPRPPSRPPHETSRPPHEPSRPPHEPSRPPHEPSRPPHEPSRPPHEPSRPPHEPSRPPHQPSRPPLQSSTGRSAETLHLGNRAGRAGGRKPDGGAAGRERGSREGERQRKRVRGGRDEKRTS